MTLEEFTQLLRSVDLSKLPLTEYGKVLVAKTKGLKPELPEQLEDQSKTGVTTQ